MRPEKMTNIYISGLPPKADEIELVKLFIPFAKVNTVQIARDKRTGKPKGFAFIELHNHAEAVEAVSNLNGTTFEGATLTIKIAEDKADRQNNKRQPPPRPNTGNYVKVERFSPNAERYSPAEQSRPKRPRTNRG